MSDNYAQETIETLRNMVATQAKQIDLQASYETVQEDIINELYGIIKAQEETIKILKGE